MNRGLSERTLAAGACVLSMASSYFVVRFPDTPGFSFVSTAFIVLFALPSCVALTRWAGLRRGVAAIAALSFLPLAVEAFAVWTGFPYGGFSYSGKLGPTLMGLVPFSVAFAYLPILLGSMGLASRFSGRNLVRFAAASSAVNVAMDLVIDPAAVSIGFWSYADPGPYYGVPAVNFLGWLLTGFIYSAIFYLLMGEKAEYPVPPRVTLSLLLILSFWTGYSLLNSLALPGLMGSAWTLLLLKSYE